MATAEQGSNALLAINPSSGGLVVSPVVPATLVGPVLLGPDGGPLYAMTSTGGVPLIQVSRSIGSARYRCRLSRCPAVRRRLP